jgi:hypothetical protein
MHSDVAIFSILFYIGAYVGSDRNYDSKVYISVLEFFLLLNGKRCFGPTLPLFWNFLKTNKRCGKNQSKQMRGVGKKTWG